MNFQRLRTDYNFQTPAYAFDISYLAFQKKYKRRAIILDTLLNLILNPAMGGIIDEGIKWVKISYKSLSERTGVSESTLKRYIKHLGHIIKSDQIYYGHDRTNIYTVDLHALEVDMGFPLIEIFGDKYLKRLWSMIYQGTDKGKTAPVDKHCASGQFHDVHKVNLTSSYIDSNKRNTNTNTVGKAFSVDNSLFPDIDRTPDREEWDRFNIAVECLKAYNSPKRVVLDNISWFEQRIGGLDENNHDRIAA